MDKIYLFRRDGNKKLKGFPWKKKKGRIENIRIKLKGKANKSHFFLKKKKITHIN